MKFPLILVLLAVGLVGVSGKYEASYNLFVREVVQDDRLLVIYARCLLNLDRCPPIIVIAKSVLVDILRTNCAECDDEQKELASQLARNLRDKHPDLWEQMLTQYDRRAFEAFL
nr:chemosensory protein 6 [Conopomorpha sinensis]